MKLAPREAPAYFKRPDPGKAGLLIYGPDPMRIADARREITRALAGPDGTADMRVQRLSASDLRKDPAQLLDELKARGFFAGPRVVIVEEATDALTKILQPALDEWHEGDAHLIVTAGQLTARSSLRKLFESSRTAYATALYDDPMSREAVQQAITTAGLRDVPRDAIDALFTLSRSLEPGDFRQTLERIALYKHGDSAPLGISEIEALAPQSAEADLDDLLNIVAEGQRDTLHQVLHRLYAQGVQPVTLCIGALRHFRILHQAAAHPGGAAAGVGALRPPVFGPRRDRITRQAGKWGMFRLEQAIATLVETDLALRSATRAPQMALVERALIRLLMIGAR